MTESAVDELRDSATQVASLAKGAVLSGHTAVGMVEVNAKRVAAVLRLSPVRG